MSAQCEQFDTFSDCVVETFMTDIGISWVETVVNVASIDLSDNSFQTRLNVAHCSTVAREYADKIKCGDRFPMIVLQHKGNGRYRVVCGRHRATAYNMAQNGKAAFRAYVVPDNTPADLLLALSARDNNANGVRQGNGETARVAADFLAQLPLPVGLRCHRKNTIKQAALRFGAHVSTVTGHYHAKLVTAEMMRAGCNSSQVPMSALRSLWQWTDNAAWVNIAKTVCANYSLANLGNIIASANAENLDAAALMQKINSAAAATGGVENIRPQKDPAHVTLEHLSLALQDLNALAPPQNLQEELAEDIASTVEALRIACKEWKKR